MMPLVRDSWFACAGARRSIAALQQSREEGSSRCRWSVMSRAPRCGERVPLGGVDLPPVTSSAFSGRPALQRRKRLSALLGIPYASRQLALSSVLAAQQLAVLTVSSPSVMAANPGGPADVCGAWGAASPVSIGACGQRRSLAAVCCGRRPFGTQCGSVLDQLAVTPNPSLQRTTTGRSPGCRR